MSRRAESWSTLTESQQGVISRAQARQCGLSVRQIDWLLQKRRWVPVFPSVYRVAGSPVAWPQTAMAASLWGGGAAALSHRAAAALWDLDGFRNVPVELSGTGPARVPKGLVFHRVRRLGRADVTTRRGIRVTTVERTLLDLAGVVPERTFERTLDECLRLRLTEVKQVQWCIDRNGRRGRQGVALLERLLEERRGQAPKDSAAETDAGAAFRRAGLPAPRTNFEVVVDGRLVARVDFAWPRARVAVQVHSAFHRQPRNWERDQDVENRLIANGWLVLKVTRKMLDADERAVTTMVKRVLAGRERD